MRVRHTHTHTHTCKHIKRGLYFTYYTRTFVLDTHAYCRHPQSRTIIFDSISDGARVRHTHTCKHPNRRTIISKLLNEDICVRHTHMREHTQRQAHTYMTHTQTLTRTHTHTHTHAVVSTPDWRKKYEMVGHVQYLSNKSRSFALVLSSGFFGQV